MHKIAAALHLAHQFARAQNIALDQRTAIELRQATRTRTHERAYAIARRQQCAQDMIADEATGPGQKDRRTLLIAPDAQPGARRYGK